MFFDFITLMTTFLCCCIAVVVVALGITEFLDARKGDQGESF